MQRIAKLSLLTSAMIFAGILIVTAVSAQPGGPPHHGPDFIRLLDLSEQQLDQLMELRDELELKRVEIHAAQARLQIQLRAELRADNVNMTKVEQLVEQMADNHKEMMLVRIRHLVEFRGLLTSQQRQRFDELRLGDAFIGGPPHGGRGGRGPGMGNGQGPRHGR